jgi:hypothetical protein
MLPHVRRERLEYPTDLGHRLPLRTFHRPDDTQRLGFTKGRIQFAATARNISIGLKIMSRESGFGAGNAGLNACASGLAHQPFSEWNNIDRPPLFETHQDCRCPAAKMELPNWQAR